MAGKLTIKNNSDRKIISPPLPSILWLLVIYSLLYLTAINRYESRLLRVEQHLDRIASSITERCGIIFLHDIKSINKTKIPYQPSFLNPLSLIYSNIDYYDIPYFETLDHETQSWLKQISDCDNQVK
jgi:hypothetical protein